MEESKLFNEKAILAKWNAEMYDLNESDIDDVEFALSVIGGTPKKILEIACGSGRFLVPMAKAGHMATGLDFDEYMLNKIQAKSTQMSNINWRKADVIRDEWGSGFDVVMLAGNFLFNLISDMDYEEAQQLLFRKAAHALVPGGNVYIDYAYTMHPETWFNKPGETTIWEGTDSSGNTGRMSLVNSTFDKERKIIQFTRSFKLTLNNGHIITEDIPSVKHFATLEQIHTWLSANGFIVQKEYGDYNRNPISENTNRAIIWARKI